MRLLERDPLLARLTERLADARGGSGRVVLIGGDAGSGKTSLVRELTAGIRDPVLWGACEPMGTARPLGPIADIAHEVGVPLTAVLDDRLTPTARLSMLLGWLARQPAAVVLVVEDAHWADEASLDLLRHLAGRITSLPILLLVTYRHDELDPVHPLRVLLGDTARHRGVSRMTVPPLTAAAVAELAAPHGVDAALLHARSGGNAFIVTEVLATGDPGRVPDTVSDAVLARVARMSAPGRAALDLVAVLPGGLPLTRVADLGVDALALDECVRRGMLHEADGTLAFRHELVRAALYDALAPLQRRALHRRVATALAGTAGAGSAELAHHAEAAGEPELVRRYAPRAGAEAAALGAHREAARQYRRALHAVTDGDDAVRADLLTQLADQCYITGEFTDAIAAQTEAIACHRRLGDALREGDGRRALSRLLRYVGRSRDAMEAGLQAVEQLEGQPAGHELAMAYCNVSHLHMVLEDLDETVSWGRRALELADRLDDMEARVYALTNIGVVEVQARVPEAHEHLETALRLADDADLAEHAGRAHVDLVWFDLRFRDLDDIERRLDGALAYCTGRGLDVWRLLLTATRARVELDRGRWAAATDAAAEVLRDPRPVDPARVVALVVLGLVRARRGDPDHASPLHQAAALAWPTGELQRRAPVAAALAEVAWMEGRPGDLVEATDDTLRLAHRRRAGWVVGDLACWRQRLGVPTDVTDAAGPFVLSLRGAHREAAAEWEALGCPYEQALALADAGDVASLQRARDLADGLGARPLVARTSRALRERGVRGIPRGVRRTTAATPGLLTVREVEVLTLLADGLRNAEIAQRLHVARRTVDNHVSSILGKLEAVTRTEAVSAARRLQLVD